MSKIVLTQKNLIAIKKKTIPTPIPQSDIQLITI